MKLNLGLFASIYTLGSWIQNNHECRAGCRRGFGTISGSGAQSPTLGVYCRNSRCKRCEAPSRACPVVRSMNLENLVNNLTVKYLKYINEFRSPLGQFSAYSHTCTHLLLSDSSAAHFFPL